LSASASIVVENGKIGPAVWQALGRPGYPSIANLTGFAPLPLFGSREWDGGPSNGNRLLLWWEAVTQPQAIGR